MSCMMILVPEVVDIDHCFVVVVLNEVLAKIFFAVVDVVLNFAELV